MESVDILNHEKMKKVNLAAFLTFHTLIRKGDFLEASQALGIPRYQIHRDIKALEKMLGGDLITKDKKRLTLTLLGKKMVQILNDMFNSFRSLDSAACQVTEIIVSSTNAVAMLILPQVMREFKSRYPNIAIKVLSGMSYLDFETTGCDVVIGRSFTNRSDLSQHHLADYTYSFYAHPDYLKEHGWPKGIDDFRGHALLLPKGFGKSVVDEAILDNNWVYAESTVVDVQIHSANFGLGIALMPEETVAVANTGLVKVIDSIEYRVPLVFSFQQASFKKGVLLEFRQIVAEAITNDLAQCRAVLGKDS